MTDPIRESVAKRLYPEAWYFAGSDEDKCAALAKADYAIRAVTGALEAQGYVVVPREPTGTSLPPLHPDFRTWREDVAAHIEDLHRRVAALSVPDPQGRLSAEVIRIAESELSANGADPARATVGGVGTNGRTVWVTLTAY